MRARLACIIFLLALGCSKSDGPQIATVAPDAFEKPKAPEPEEPAAPAAPVAVDDADSTPKVELHKLALPPDGGAWPIVAALPVTSQPVSLTNVLTEGMHVHGAAVRPAAGRAVVMVWQNDFKRKKNGTHVFWCDLNRGKVTHTWDVVKERYLQAFDLHADGRQFLVRQHDGSDRERHTLELWTIDEDGRLLRKQWDPYYAGQNDGDERENDAHKMRRPEADVRWAAFAGREHIVTVCGSGEMKVWERDSLKQVALLNGVVGLPAMANDGRHVAFIHGERLALLDPKSLKVTAAMQIGKPPENAVIAFRGDGKRLAIGGTHRAIVVNLESGGSWNTMLPELRLEQRELLPDFGWAGAEDFYFRGDLYDLQVPIKVWHYGVPHWASVRGGQVWAVTNALGEKETVLAAFTVPHPRAAGAIRAAGQRTDLFALRPGDNVRVNVTGIPVNKQKEVREVLERRVKELGYRLDPSAPTIFMASADSAGPRVTKSYTVGTRRVTGSYNERFARLKIIKNGQVLWEANDTDSPGLLIVIPNNVEPEDYISRFGTPDYCLFTKRPLPGVLRNGKDAQPLGQSELAARGIRER